MGLVACSSDDPGGAGPGAAPVGTVELGAMCNRAAECKPVAGKEVGCECAGGTDATVCIALLDIGERCGNGPLACRSGSACVADDRGNVQCKALAAAGASCADTLCAPGSSCDDASELCVAARPIGQACDPSEPQPCQAGAHCSGSTLVCEADVPEFGQCSSDQECGMNSRCVSFNNSATCFRIKKQGEECQHDFECDDGLDCDVAHRCVPRDSAVQCGF